MVDGFTVRQPLVGLFARAMASQLWFHAWSGCPLHEERTGVACSLTYRAAHEQRTCVDGVVTGGFTCYGEWIRFDST